MKLGPLLFCLATQEAFESVQRRHPNVTLTAYLDDVTIVGSTDAEVTSAADDLTRTCAALGIEPNYAKCRFFTAGDRARRAIVDGTVACATGAEKILGSFFSPNESAADDEKRAVTERITSSVFWKRLREMEMRCHVRYQLLRVCGLPRMQFAMRTHEYAIVCDAAHWTDRQVEEILCAMLRKRKLSERAMRQARLPIKKGGLGLRSQLALATFAHECTLLSKGAQKERTAQLDAQVLSSLLSAASAPETNALLAASATGASKPLSDVECALSDEAWRLYVQVRLNTRVSDDGMKCCCGQDATNAHVFSCTHLAKAKIARHDAVVRSVARCLKQFGLDSSVEPSSAVEGNKSRPDLMCATYVTDLTIANPLGDAVRYEPLMAAHRAEDVKNRKWADWAEARGLAFSPLVFEATGGHTQATKRWLNAAAGLGQAMFARPGETGTSALLAECIKTLHTGNLMLFANALGY